MRSSRHFNKNWQALTKDIFKDCTLLTDRQILEAESTNFLINKWASSLSYQYLNVSHINIKDINHESLKDHPSLIVNFSMSNTIITNEEVKDPEEKKTIVHFQKSIPFTFEILVDYLVIFHQFLI